MTISTKNGQAVPTEQEVLMKAQIRELQHIVELMLRSEMNITPPALVADGIALVTPKQAMHITGLSRSAIQKLLKANPAKVDARMSHGRWYINPVTLPRRVGRTE